jgi:hypothetical protein
MATVRKPQEAPTSSPACTQEIPTLSSVYVVVGESYDQMENNEKDVINIRHGILRIFANKEDVKAYMQKYFNDSHDDDASFYTQEDKKGFYKAEINVKSPKYFEGSVSFEGSLEGRVYKLNVKAYKVDITTGVEGLVGDNDLYDALYD